MLDVTLLYHEEAHGGLVHEICKPLDAEDPVAPRESAERYHGLVGVQDYGAGNAGIYSSDQVLGLALVGLQVIHQGIDIATLATEPARQLTGLCPRTGGRRSGFGAVPHRGGGPDRRGEEEGPYPQAYRGQRVAAYPRPG